MTIAQALKYIQYLTEKLAVVSAKIKQVEVVKIQQRIVSSQATTNIVEQTEYTINPKELMWEYDSIAKELRLVKDEVERLNHTTTLNFTPKY